MTSNNVPSAAKSAFLIRSRVDRGYLGRAMRYTVVVLGDEEVDCRLQIDDRAQDAALKRSLSAFKYFVTAAYIERFLQSETQALDDRILEPYGVREPGGISLGGCHTNRVQAEKHAFYIL
jgi:hypothetical protein